MNKKLDIIEIINFILKNYHKSIGFNNLLDQAFIELKIPQKIKQTILSDEIFVNGYDSLFDEINLIIDKQMERGKPKDFEKYRINEKIKFLVFYRIKVIEKIFGRKKLFKIAFSEKSLLRLKKMLFNISDEIWFLSGDKSTDFNYYSKRIILMNIYLSSFLYSLSDKSDNFEKTKAFIEKQINQVLVFGRIKSRIKSIFYPKSI